MKKRISIIFTLVKVALDGIVVYLSFSFAYWLRFNSQLIPAPKGIPPVEIYTNAIPVVILIFLAAGKWNRFYEERSNINSADELINIFKATTTAMVLTFAATFIYRQYSYSRLVLAIMYVNSIILLYLTHNLLRLARLKLFSGIYSNGCILIIGDNRAKEPLMRGFSEHGHFKINHHRSIDIEKIKKLKETCKIEEVFLSDTEISKKNLLELIDFCEEENIEFRMVPDMIELKMGEMTIDSYFGIPVLKLKHPLFEPSNYYFKRSFDIIVSMMLLAFLSPFLLLIAILIYIDSPGPIIYYHRRKGYKGKDFKFYKFRSMVKEADNLLPELLQYNERDGSAFKMKKDPRITRVGRFIRKYSIDEIPQLINVLKADMSLVGPRPQVLWETKNYDEQAKRRLRILPGITGLWQVSGRSDLSYEEMIKLDLYYLENWTPGFDIKILLETIPVVVLRKGAC